MEASAGNCRTAAVSVGVAWGIENHSYGRAACILEVARDFNPERQRVLRDGGRR